ncbi:hypothetical protein Tco_0874663 [Tanacetum coccineum]|uniref:Uncharacterized protein n=1 Tax=Tanacetum coccineum TaxID=301880 RepID=A0ABQ5BQ94_9ASTR
MQEQESLITEGASIEACLVTEGAALEACLVNEGNENRSSDHESTSSGNDADDNIGPSYESDTLTKVPHSSNDTFQNVFSHGIQSHEQPESVPDTYEVNEINSNIISDIPNMDPDRNKEEHDHVDYEQQLAFFASLINNLKCDVEKCNEVNREAQQANALLTNKIERYKEKEKHFAKDMTIESEYCKKIKLLNDEISYLKSQACEKDKTFAKENEKYDEYVQPLLNRKNELEKKNQGVLKQINDLDNKGLGFENQNDYVNPSLLNKAKELAPCLYNIDEMGKDELSDHKIISDEELKCEAEKHLKVKERKSPLAMLKFEKQTFPNIEINQGDLFRMSFEQSINERVRNRLSEEFDHLVKNVNLQLNCFEKSLVKEMKDDLKDETNQCDDVKLKFDFDEIETQNIELKHKVASLIKENEHLKMVYKNLFDSIKKSQVPTQSSNVSQNEAENLKSQLSKFADKKFYIVLQKIESMKKKKFESRNSNDLLQKYLYDSDPSNVESESGEKKILFGNDTSCLKTKIKELEMSLAQQTKDFEDAKVDFSKKTDKFETYFEKHEKTKVVIERQLDRKIQDSKAEKDQFLKQIASLESKLASQDLISNQMEYRDLRSSYNALK